MKPNFHDVYPEKAQFLRNQPISIAVELDLPFALDDGRVELEAKIYDLNVYKLKSIVSRLEDQILGGRPFN